MLVTVKKELRGQVQNDSEASDIAVGTGFKSGMEGSIIIIISWYYNSGFSNVMAWHGIIIIILTVFTVLLCLALFLLILLLITNKYTIVYPRISPL